MTIRGEDLTRLSALINRTKLFPYLTHRLRHRNSQNRSDAAFLLGLARAHPAKEHLRQGLKDRDDAVVLNCALSLAKLRATDTVSDILFEYRRRKNYSRDLLLCILFEFGNSVCQPLLQQLLKEKEDASRILIIDVLGHFRYYPAGGEILNLLNTSLDNELRIHCMKAIGRMEYMDALPILRKCLDDPDWAIRSQAIRALGKIEDISVEKNLVAKLEDENWWVRYRAAEALFNLSEHGKEMLTNVSAHSENEKASTAARMLLTEKAMGI